MARSRVGLRSMGVEICRRKKWSRNLRRFWVLATPRWMILPALNSFRRFVTATRFHAKLRCRFITNRGVEWAECAGTSGRNAGKRFFPARSVELCPRSHRVRAQLEFVRWRNRRNRSLQRHRRRSVSLLCAPECTRLRQAKSRWGGLRLFQLRGSLDVERVGERKRKRICSHPCVGANSRNCADAEATRRP